MDLLGTAFSLKFIMAGTERLIWHGLRGGIGIELRVARVLTLVSGILGGLLWGGWAEHMHLLGSKDALYNHWGDR